MTFDMVIFIFFVVAFCIVLFVFGSPSDHYDNRPPRTRRDYDDYDNRDSRRYDDPYDRPYRRRYEDPYDSRYDPRLDEWRENYREQMRQRSIQHLVIVALAFVALFMTYDSCNKSNAAQINPPENVSKRRR